jgi:hypothetical protein
VAGRFEGTVELLPAADELEEALPCGRDVLPDGLACAESAQPQLRLLQLLLAVCRLRPGAARATFLFVHWTTTPRPNSEPTACEKDDSEQQLEDYR